MQCMAELKAGEAAKIQLHLLDDLVRVVSYNFEQFSSIGTTKIFHDGEDVNLEAYFSHLAAEALGVPQREEKTEIKAFNKTSVVTADDKSDVYELTQPHAKQVERLKMFVGALGDFIQFYLSAPNAKKYIESINTNLYGEVPEAENAPDTGLFKLHITTEGGVHIRSVKEIFIEKSNWIRVPERIEPDEKYVEGESGQKTEKTNFEFDEQFKIGGDPYLYYLQLRDYLALYFENVSTHNFSQQNKKFKLDSDSDKSAPEFGDSVSIDPYTKAKYTKRTAGIYLMENGGLVLKDGFGSAIVMEGGNIYIQPTYDIVEVYRVIYIYANENE
jgi:hypothetical protein